MKHIQEFTEYLNESSFLSIGGEYWDLYITKEETTIGKIIVPKDTVIQSVGGGNWQSLDGKFNFDISDLKGNPVFKIVNSPVWPMTVELTKSIESWARDTKELIRKDPKNTEKIIADRTKVINDIKKLLK